MFAQYDAPEYRENKVEATKFIIGLLNKPFNIMNEDQLKRYYDQINIKIEFNFDH
jgi:hypothetical protein